MKDYYKYCCVAIIILILVNIGLSIWSITINKNKKNNPITPPTPNPSETIVFIKNLSSKFFSKDFADIYYETGNKMRIAIKVLSDMGKLDQMKTLTNGWDTINKELYILIENPKAITPELMTKLISTFSTLSKDMDIIINN